MTNYFSVLGVSQSLTLETAEIDSAWQALTRATTENSESASEESSETHQARAVLSDPVLRLEHWLEIQGIEKKRGESMEPDLMDLFSTIHSALEKADSVLSKHKKATTALAQALLSKEAVAAHLAIQR